MKDDLGMGLEMLRAKVADTAYSQQEGLMFVEDLPSDEGMLFVFKRAGNLSFWGMNTFIPLDIAFIDTNNRIIKISKIEPHSLKQVSSDKSCPMALEVNAGYFDEHQIAVGDILKFNDGPRTAFIESDVAYLSFDKNIVKDLDTKKLNFKKSQVVSDPVKVDKPGSEPQGQPITTEVNDVELPVVNAGDVGGILEDSFDEPQEQEDNQDVDQTGQPIDDTQPPAEDQETQEQAPESEPEKEYPVFSNAFQATEWAEQNGEVMRISYTTRRGRALVRDIEPHGKFHSDSTDRQILVTFDETVGDVRAFIVTNISQWAFVDRQFSKKFVVKG